MRSVSSTWLAILALLVAMASIQIGASIAKELFAVLNVAEVTFVRLGIAAIIMVLLARSWRARIRSDNWKALAVYGASLAGMNIMFYLAIQTLPLGIAAAIQFLGPLSVAILVSRRTIDFIWSGLAAGGLILNTGLIGFASQIDLVGLGWALGAAICWALYIVAGKQAGSQHGSQAAALGMVIAAIISAPFGVAEFTPDAYSMTVVVLLLVIAILSGVVPFTLEMFALRALPSRTFGTLMSLEPVLAALIGLVRLGEKLSTHQLVGILLIVVASAGASLSARENGV